MCIFDYFICIKYFIVVEFIYINKSKHVRLKSVLLRIEFIPVTIFPHGFLSYSFSTEKLDRLFAYHSAVMADINGQNGLNLQENRYF